MKTPIFASHHPKKTVLIVEGEELLGHLLKEFICRNSDLLVLGVATQIDEAIELCHFQEPDVLIVAPYLKDGADGIRLVTKFIDENFKGKIIFLTRDVHPDFIRNAALRGASAVVSRACLPAVVLEVVHDLLSREVAPFRVIPDKIFTSCPAQADTGRYSILTDAEKDILLLIARGLTVKEIAFEIQKAHTTIYSHQQHIRDKFNIHRTSDLFNLAVEYYLTQNNKEMA